MTEQLSHTNTHTHKLFLSSYPPLSFPRTTQCSSSLLLTLSEGFVWQLLDLNYLSLTNIKRRLLFVCLFHITKTPGEVLALGIVGSRDKWLWISLSKLLPRKLFLCFHNVALGSMRLTSFFLLKISAESTSYKFSEHEFTKISFDLFYDQFKNFPEVLKEIEFFCLFLITK